MQKIFLCAVLLLAVAVQGNAVRSDSLLRVVPNGDGADYVVVNGCDSIGADGYVYVNIAEEKLSMVDSLQLAMAAARMALALRIDSIIDEAHKHLGKKYRMGSTGPNRFDCSGFTSYVFRQFDVRLTRTSRSQYLEGEPVDKENVRPGDLVFFNGRRSRRGVGHVGIVVDKDTVNGGFNFIHASIKGVRVTNSEQEYYRVRYVGARRVLTSEINRKED